MSAEVPYELEGEVDVGTGNDTARKIQVQPLGKNSSYHQQGGYIL